MFQLTFSYIVWHYSKAYVEIALLTRHFITFFYHLFSIQVLLRTLFSPWKMLGERYKGGMHFGENLGIFALNSVMRVVGFFMRLIIIFFGLLVIVFTLLLSALVFIFWTLLPIVIFFLFVLGLRLLSKKII